ncbi:MAG TPA: hypothetical protein VLF71_01930 [Candidatus Saccharimonadales bacterium]|nr:hypothetical protein [Candidatus Saccharimonadales bacterium]
MSELSLAAPTYSEALTALQSPAFAAAVTAVARHVEMSPHGDAAFAYYKSPAKSLSRGPRLAFAPREQQPLGPFHDIASETLSYDGEIVRPDLALVVHGHPRPKPERGRRIDARSPLYTDIGHFALINRHNPGAIAGVATPVDDATIELTLYRARGDRGYVIDYAELATTLEQGIDPRQAQDAISQAGIVTMTGQVVGSNTGAGDIYITPHDALLNLFQPALQR